MEAASAALEDATRTAVQGLADAFGGQSVIVLQKAAGGQAVLGSQAQLTDLLTAALEYSCSSGL